MGDIYLDITVMNDADLEKQKQVQFLADTGATRAWIPKTLARELDIKEVGKVPLELANGKIQKYPYGLCKFEYEGELINGTVVIAPANIEPIVGTHVLQDFRLVLDMVHHTVKRARAMKAKQSKQPATSDQ
jgi:predicted aspartyl protease